MTTNGKRTDLVVVIGELGPSCESVTLVAGVHPDEVEKLGTALARMQRVFEDAFEVPEEIGVYARTEKNDGRSVEWTRYNSSSQDLLAVHAAAMSNVTQQRNWRAVEKKCQLK